MISTIVRTATEDLRPGMVIVTAFGPKVFGTDTISPVWTSPTALVRVPVADLGMGVL